MFLRITTVTRFLKPSFLSEVLVVTELSLQKQLQVNFYLLILLVLTGLVYTAAGQAMSGLYFIFSCLLICLLFIFLLNDPVLRWVLLAALAVRVGLALIQAYTAIDLPGAGGDSLAFEKFGWQNARAWLHGDVETNIRGAYLYTAWIGLLYFFFGRVPFIPKLFHVMVSLVTIYIIYRTTFLYTFSVRVCRIAGLLLTLVPALNFFSAIVLRETMIIFTLSLSFYFIVRWMQEGRLSLVFGSFLSLVLAGMLHGPLILILAIYLVMVCFYSPGERRFRLVLWQIIPAALLGLVAFLLIGEYITYQLPGNLADIITPDFMRHVVERKTLSRTSYLQGLVPYTYFDLVWQTPIRLLYFMYAPFPWMIKTFSDILGGIDSLLYLFLTCYAVKGGWVLWRSNKQVVLTASLVIFTLVLMFAWGTTNYGTAWRHRQKAAPFMVMLASVGVAASNRWQWLLLKDGEQLYLENGPELNVRGESFAGSKPGD